MIRSMKTGNHLSMNRGVCAVHLLTYIQVSAMVVSTMGLRLAYKFERCDYPEEMGGDAVMK